MLDAIQLAIFNGQLTSICEEMGFVLQRSAVSPNIKDRLDFSCAFFDHKGEMASQAAHIPVHLGSMAYAMRDIVESVQWQEGDCLVMNDPFMGGTHLPDVTLITPLYVVGQHCGFVANRAHHANIGAESPGSMPLSSKLDEEGVLIKPVKLLKAGSFNPRTVALLNSIEGVDSANEAHLSGDFLAQLSANRLGVERFGRWIAEIGVGSFQEGLKQINVYARSLCLGVLSKLPKGTYASIDIMESDGFGAKDIEIRVSLSVKKEKLVVDFSGTASQVKGNINCPDSVAAAAIYYVYMCLMPDYVPMCQGAFDLVDIRIPSGSILSPSPGKAVAAGNVETSMRIVDVLLSALAKADSALPASAQGTMNNVAMGGAKIEGKRWDYYETIGGGMGASRFGNGLDAVQCHMTNTLNTPIESLEMHYPMRISQYALRDTKSDVSSSEDYLGGRGLVRTYQFLQDTSVTLLTERREVGPAGLNGGDLGLKGENWLNDKVLPGKCSIEAKKGDQLTIKTPGGGGWRPVENG